MQLRRELDAKGLCGSYATLLPKAAITVVHKITAARDLIQLAGWEVLQTAGEGRSTSYYQNLPGWVEG